MVSFIFSLEYTKHQSPNENSFLATAIFLLLLGWKRRHHLQVQTCTEETMLPGQGMAFAAPAVGPPGHWVRRARHRSRSMNRLLFLQASSPSFAVFKCKSSCNTPSARRNWFVSSSMAAFNCFTSHIRLKRQVRKKKRIILPSF